MGGIIGGMAGAAVGMHSKSYVYALAAAVLISLAAEMVTYMLLRGRHGGAFRVYVEQPANSVLATLSFVMAAAGVFVIVVAREWLVGLAALFFFGLCGVHFVRSLRQSSGQ